MSSSTSNNKNKLLPKNKKSVDVKLSDSQKSKPSLQRKLKKPKPNLSEPSFTKISSENASPVHLQDFGYSSPQRFSEMIMSLSQSKNKTKPLLKTETNKIKPKKKFIQVGHSPVFVIEVPVTSPSQKSIPVAESYLEYSPTNFSFTKNNSSSSRQTPSVISPITSITEMNNDEGVKNLPAVVITENKLKEGKSRVLFNYDVPSNVVKNGQPMRIKIDISVEATFKTS